MNNRSKLGSAFCAKRTVLTHGYQNPRFAIRTLSAASNGHRKFDGLTLNIAASFANDRFGRAWI
jgi:hypothetical protein